MPQNETNDFPDDPGLKDQPEQTGPHTEKKPAVFNFWQGLSTVLAAAFIVATLFTLWTPGSLVESSLEARMAQVLDPASAEGEILLEGAPNADEEADWERIGIVSGHYGHDSGAVCANGVTEAELNLKIATIVQKMLTDRGYEVDLLQEFDERLWGYKAAVIVSIHLDSCEYINELATGYKVASALATQDHVANQRLTRCLSEKYGEVTGLPYHAGSVTDDMTYYHAFYEVDDRTPAAIIEAGFMNLDYQFITEQTDQVAEGIVAGIMCFFYDESQQPDQGP